jgi:hypothetical protein
MVALFSMRWFRSPPWRPDGHRRKVRDDVEQGSVFSV